MSRDIWIEKQGLAIRLGKGVGRLNGLRYPVEDLLDCAEADLETQYGIAEGLDNGTTVHLRPRHLGNEGAQPWVIARQMLLGNQSLVRLPVKMS